MTSNASPNTKDRRPGRGGVDPRIKYIDAIIRNAAAEANAYPDLVNLLTDDRCLIALKRDRVVGDSRLTTGRTP
jgi:hypothetical protein